ncbi:MAG: hypothetical protein QXY39_01925 [Thermofilaceae archaeon]
MAQEKRARLVIGPKEKLVLKALIQSNGCIDGMLELINRAYPGVYHKRSYFRNLSRRLYRMQEKGLIRIEPSAVRVKAKGRKRSRICITSFGLRSYYQRLFQQ